MLAGFSPQWSMKLIVPKGFSPIFPDGRVKQKD